MKVLVNTNVVLDIALERLPFFEQSARFLDIAYQSGTAIYITATTITDLYYIVRKAKSRDMALTFIRDLLKFVDVAAVDKNVIVKALQLNMVDFEDAIQASVAQEETIDIIVTRNEGDFSDADLEIHSPTTFLQRFN